MNYPTISEVTQNDPCNNCKPCLRLRLMDMGFIPGQEIDIEDERLGLHLVHLMSDNGHVEQTFALRPEELGRICLNNR